jgi:hypothetical protein
MNNKLRTIAAAAVASTVLLAVGVSSAQAKGLGDCYAAGQVCMWEDPGAQGSNYVAHSATVGKYEIGGFNGDNEISSIVNATGYCVTLYDNDGWTGTSKTFQPHTELLNFGSYDNEAESYKIWAC